MANLHKAETILNHSWGANGSHQYHAESMKPDEELTMHVRRESSSRTIQQSEIRTGTTRGTGRQGLGPDTELYWLWRAVTYEQAVTCGASEAMSMKLLQERRAPVWKEASKTFSFFEISFLCHKIHFLSAFNLFTACAPPLIPNVSPPRFPPVVTPPAQEA